MTTAVWLQECTGNWEPSHTLANCSVLPSLLVLCLIATCLSPKGKKKKKESYVCAVQHFAVMIRGSQLLPGNVEIPGRKQPPAAFVLSEQKYVLAVNG